MKGSFLALALLLSLPAAADETLAVLVVDGKPVGTEARMLDPDKLSFTVAEWTAFGVVVPSQLRQREMLSSNELGVQVVYDEAAVEVQITIPAALRPKQKLGYVRALPQAVSPAPKGVMLDYDVAVVAQGDRVGVSVGHTARTSIAGGVLTTTGHANWSDDGGNYQRGTTTWRKDNLDRGTTVQIGDVALSNNGLNNSAVLGGVRMGTDRQLTRYGYGMDIPMIGGLADTRSTAEVFVNEHRRATGQIDPGPYELAPTIGRPGLNNVEVVQRDQFGREQTFSRSFYAHPDLLRKGNKEWDVSAGAVRVDPTKDRYAGFAIQGSARFGLSDRWTLGATVQDGKIGDQGGRNLTLQNTVSLGHFGLVQADVSASQSDDGAAGKALRVAYERQSPNWSITASHLRKSEHYWEISDLQESRFKIKSQTTAALRFNPAGQPWRGTLSYTDIRYDNHRLQQVAVAGSFRQRNATWLVGGLHDVGSGDNQIFASVQLPLGGGRTSFTARSAPNSGPSLAATYNNSTELRGRDVRYQVSGFMSDTASQLHGRVDTTVAGGDLSLEARTTTDMPVLVNARYRNSVWLGEGGVINGRGNNPNGSYLLVEVPGQASIDIRSNHPTPTPTNRRGYALLPGVLSLSPATVRLDATQLPLDQQIESDVLTAVPARKGGAKVVFSVVEQTTRQWEVRTNNGYAPQDSLVTSDQGESFRLGARGVLVLDEPAQTVTVEMNGKIWVSGF